MNIDTVYDIPGFLDTHEAYLLNHLAKSQQQAVIVEIGTYYGRATYCLATGAKVSGAHVYTIDAYTPHTIGEMIVLPEIAQAVKVMLKEQVLGRHVTMMIGEAKAIGKIWEKPIDLLFIDGSHEYKDVKADFNAWKKHVKGVIAFHDYTDHWPGVQKFVNELVASEQWAIVEQADATVVLRKA